MLGVEARDEIGNRRPLGAVERHFECLAGIANVDFDAQFLIGRGDAFCCKFADDLCDDFLDHRADFGVIGLCHQLVETALRIDT